MSNPIEGISGSSHEDARLDMIQAYMERDDNNSLSDEFSASDHSDLSSVESSIPLEDAMFDIVSSQKDVSLSDNFPIGMNTVEDIEKNGNEKPDLGDNDQDGIPNYLDGNSDFINEATQVVIDGELSLDSDGDGIIDILDATGSESRIEQMYDEDGEGDVSPENVRAFLSLMSMFNNLDLTALADKFTENGGDSLASMAIAGMAQVAITHSAQLQEPLPNIVVKKQDIKKAIEQYKKQNDKEKRNNLITLNRLVDAMPTSHPMKTVLQSACKSSLARKENRENEKHN